MSASEEQLGRSIAAGSKQVVNGIALPSDVARRLLRTTNVATKDTFLVTCFVDALLDPPHRISTHHREREDSTSPPKPTAAMSKKSHRTTKVGFDSMALSAGGQSASCLELSLEPPAMTPKSPFISSRSPSCHVLSASSTQPLHDQLRHAPKGPYHVRLPTSASIEEAAAIVQNALRDIQLRERQDLLFSQKEHGKQLLYSFPLAACDEIAQRRVAASKTSFSHRASSDGRSPPQASIGAVRRTSLFGGGQRGAAKRPPSITPDSTSLTPGNETPAFRSITLDSYVLPTGSALSNETLSQIKTVSPDDVYGANMVSLSSLASLDFDIPRVGEVVAADVLSASEGHHSSSQSLSLGTFTAFSPAADETVGARGSDKNALIAPHSGVACASAFSQRRFTIRPCDPFGRVLKSSHSRHIAKSHSSSLGVDSFSLGGTNNFGGSPAAAPVFHPPSRPLMKCFPAGTVSFHVCLSVDDTYHRENIRGLFQRDADAKADAMGAVCEKRCDALEAKEAAWGEHNRQTVMNSILKDKQLREQVTRPSATESYKAFLKEEATEEYEKQKQRRLLQEQQDRHDAKSRVRERMKLFFRSMSELNLLETTARLTLENSEVVQWDVMINSLNSQFRELCKARRVSEGMKNARCVADAAALNCEIVERFTL